MAGYGQVGSTFQAFIGTASGSVSIPLPIGASRAYVTHGEGDSGNPLNDSGDLVGSSNIGGWIWNAADGTQLLSTLVPTGWNIEDAFSISNTGLILAEGSYGGGPLEYVELAPGSVGSASPEPATILLCAAGLLLLAGAHRRSAYGHGQIG